MKNPEKRLAILAAVVAITLGTLRTGLLHKAVYRPVQVPMASVSVSIPRVCGVRLWMNAVEANCLWGNNIDYWDGKKVQRAPLKQASPK